MTALTTLAGEPHGFFSSRRDLFKFLPGWSYDRKRFNNLLASMMLYLAEMRNFNLMWYLMKGKTGDIRPSTPRRH